MHWDQIKAVDTFLALFDDGGDWILERESAEVSLGEAYNLAKNADN